MLKLPKTKKVKLSNGQVKWEQIEADYLPVAARLDGNPPSPTSSLTLRSMSIAARVS